MEGLKLDKDSTDWVEQNSENAEQFKSNELDKIQVAESKKQLKDLRDFLTLVPEGNDYKYYIYRLKEREPGQRGKRGKYLVVQLENEFLDAHEIQNIYGGGQFVLYFKFFDSDEKPRTFTQTMNIEGTPKYPNEDEEPKNNNVDSLEVYDKSRKSMLQDMALMRQAMGNNGNGNGNNEMLMMFMKMSQDQSNMMMQMMMQQSNMMMQTLGKTIEVKAGNPDKTLDTFQRGMEIASELNPGNNEDFPQKVSKLIGGFVSGFMNSRSKSNGDGEQKLLDEKTEEKDSEDVNSAMKLSEKYQETEENNDDHPLKDDEDYKGEE